MDQEPPVPSSSQAAHLSQPGLSVPAPRPKPGQLWPDSGEWHWGSVHPVDVTGPPPSCAPLAGAVERAVCSQAEQAHGEPGTRGRGVRPGPAFPSAQTVPPPGPKPALPPLPVASGPRETEAGGRGGCGKTKGGKGGGWGGSRVGAPSPERKTPRAERQQSGSEETDGDAYPSLYLRSCPLLPPTGMSARCVPRRGGAAWGRGRGMVTGSPHRPGAPGGRPPAPSPSAPGGSCPSLQLTTQRLPAAAQFYSHSSQSTRSGAKDRSPGSGG